MGVKTTIYHLPRGIWINQENQQDSCAANQSVVVSVIPNNIISPLLMLNAPPATPKVCKLKKIAVKTITVLFNVNKSTNRTIKPLG